MLLKFHSNKDIAAFFTNYNAILNAWSSFNNSDHKSSYAPRDNAYGGMINNYTKKPKEKEIYSGEIRVDLGENTVAEIDN